MWMVRGSVDFTDTTQITQFFDETALKIVTLVIKYTGWKLVLGEEPIP